MLRELLDSERQRETAGDSDVHCECVECLNTSTPRNTTSFEVVAQPAQITNLVDAGRHGPRTRQRALALHGHERAVGGGGKLDLEARKVKGLQNLLEPTLVVRFNDSVGEADLDLMVRKPIGIGSDRIGSDRIGSG